MIDKSVHDHANLRSPPTRDESAQTRTSRGLQAPCHQTQGAFPVVGTESQTAELEPSSEIDFESQEALRNFQSYLDILREWDEAEKRKDECSSAKAV